MKKITLFKKAFQKPKKLKFKWGTLIIWDRWYSLLQPVVAFFYRMYYNKFTIYGWENVDESKPTIFAISHRNAFMDSLAFVAAKNMQVFQLARGDAWKNNLLIKTFNFFHMLPVWRERDNVDTKAMNEPTFETCYDILAHHAMIGIYPEGNCINEEHIRPLKKGICRIAFGAEEKYNYSLDIQIIPAGISYTGADKFKKWGVLNLGKPIPVLRYMELYRQNPALGIKALKIDTENGMKETVIHIEKSPYYEDIRQLADIYARHILLFEHKKYEPVNRFLYSRKIVAQLEQFRSTDTEGIKQLKMDLHNYKMQLIAFNFRENTFDKSRRNGFIIVFMGLYFVVFFPVFLYGLILNYIPYKIPELYAEKKIKQRIFHSSFKLLIGLFLMPVYYLILTFIVWLVLDSIISAIIFFISFPIAGHIAFYYWFDLKKWWSALRFQIYKGRKDKRLIELIKIRKKILQTLNNLSKSSGMSEAG